MGIWAILDPTAMEKYASAGHWHPGKQMFAEAWGPKLGMVPDWHRGRWLRSVCTRRNEPCGDDASSEIYINNDKP